MKIYHGTSSRFLSRILKSGIKPRGEDESQWAEFPSRPDLVYLTTAYPFYFSFQAMEEDEKALVLEIDSEMLEPERFLPDEDFIAEAVMKLTSEELAEAHGRIWNELENYQQHWKSSVEKLGNLAYKGTIPSEAITRYCLVDVSSQPHFVFENLEPVISVLNYRHVGSWYRGLVAWAFGDSKEWPKSSQHDSSDEQEKAIKELSENRNGIEVVTMKGKKPKAQAKTDQTPGTTSN